MGDTMPLEERSGSRGPYRLTIELPCLLIWFAVALNSGIQMNFVLYRACTVDLGYNASVCEILRWRNKTGDDMDLENEVQAKVTIVSMVTSVIGGVVPAVFSVFLGTWSDKNGRKPLIVGPLAGVFLSGLLSILYASIHSMGAWWSIMTTLPFAVLGGTSTFTLGGTLLVTDRSDQTNRFFRLGIYQSCVFLGMVLGIIASSYVNAAFGFLYSYIFVTAVHLLNLIYVLVFVDESLETATQTNFTELFDSVVFRDMYETCSRVRPKFVTPILFMLLTVLAIVMFCLSGTTNVEYLFTREKFQWLLREYSIYCSVNVMICILGMLFGMIILQKCCKMGDEFLLILSFLSCLSDSTMKGLAVAPWQMYIASTTSLLSGLVAPLVRSIVATLVLETELGKFYSMISCLEAMMPVFAPTLYNVLYYKTLTTFPGAIYLVSAGFYGLCLVLAIVIRVLSGRLPTNQYVNCSENTVINN